MRHVYLVARQEFVKYVTRRGFLISVVMFPLWIMIVIFVPRWTGAGGNEATQAFVVLDRSGGEYRRAVDDAVARDTESRDFAGWLHYADTFVDRAKLNPRSAVAQILARPETAEARRLFHFIGALGATGEVAGLLKPGSPPFRPRGARYIVLAPPAAEQKAQGDALAAYIRRTLARDDEGLAVDAVVVIPQGFGPAMPDGAQLWTRTGDDDLGQFVVGALSQALHLAVARQYAPALRHPDDLAPATLDALNEPALVEMHDLDPSGNSAVASIVPIALAIILFVVSVMNASVLLQGVVEEKSTRMIEVLLSCVTPREITAGKLIGVIAVALATLLIWALVLFALMALASHDTVALVFNSLKAIASLDTLPFLLVFFLCGLLIYGSLFLAIGSMAASLADAQSLLGPSMLILMLPNLMIGAIMHDPNGALASALTWVPLYTPFFMMLRIASHPPLWQLWGALALALTTTALLILWTGRIFAKHVLSTERPPALGALLRGLLGRKA